MSYRLVGHPPKCSASVSSRPPSGEHGRGSEFPRPAASCGQRQ